MIGTVADPIGVAVQAAKQPGILLVDDEPALLRLLEMALGQSGFAVWRAGNGVEAIELFRRHSGRIDLVLLDVQMPGLDGPQTLLALQKLNPRVRCCFMSGNAGRYGFDDLIGLGALAVLPKPFDLVAIAGTLHQLARPTRPETPAGVK